MAKNTKERILEAGIKIWLRNPLSVNAYAIAREMQIVHGTVLYHFPEGVRDAVAEYAVKTNNNKIIIQLIAAGHKSVELLDAEKRAEYVATI